MKVPDSYTYLGRLGKTYQLKGGLRLYSDLEDDTLYNLERVFIEGIGESDVREVKSVGSDIIIYLTHALTIEQAQKLVNKNLYVSTDVLPEDNLHNFIGLPVFLNGHPCGQVVGIEEGLQDLIIIEMQGKEYLLPIGAPYIRIDNTGIYLEDIPKGLLEE